VKFIVNLGTVMIEADTHKQAAELALAQVVESGKIEINVCDMDIGFKEKFVKILRADVDE
jgi:hypothetical protein